MQINTETMIFSSISTIETRTITSPIMLTISNGRRPITKVASSSSCTINTPVWCSLLSLYPHKHLTASTPAFPVPLRTCDSGCLCPPTPFQFPPAASPSFLPTTPRPTATAPHCDPSLPQRPPTPSFHTLPGSGQEKTADGVCVRAIFFINKPFIRFPSRLYLACPEWRSSALLHARSGLTAAWSSLRARSVLLYSGILLGPSCAC